MIRVRNTEPAPVAKAERSTPSNITSNAIENVRRSKRGPRSSAEAWRTYHRELMARRRVKLKADQVALAAMDRNDVGQRGKLKVPI